MGVTSQRQVLFGLNMGWHPKQWTSSDDVVRGGKSKSYLESSGTSVSFHGTLDIEALGGAGFASQRTLGDDQRWNLSHFSGIEITLDWSESDDKIYTLILKDQILPRSPLDGREQSTISWEYNFSKSKRRSDLDSGSSPTGTILIPWDHFQPTYRGKPSKDPKSLDLSGIKRFTIMTRSFFGKQHGKFHVNIISVVAILSSELIEPSPTVANDRRETEGVYTNAGPSGGQRKEGVQDGLASFWRWLWGKL